MDKNHLGMLHPKIVKMYFDLLEESRFSSVVVDRDVNLNDKYGELFVSVEYVCCHRIKLRKFLCLRIK